MQCHGRGCGSAEDHVRLQRHQFGSVGARSLDASPSPAIVDAKIAAFRPAELLQSFAEAPQPKLNYGITLVGRYQRADPSHALALLRPRRERPRRRRAEQSDERATLHSITSSARASSVGGTSRPRARAVGRFIASTNLADCTTGKSAGFSPLMIRPA